MDDIYRSLINPGLAIGPFQFVDSLLRIENDYSKVAFSLLLMQQPLAIQDQVTVVQASSSPYDAFFRRSAYFAELDTQQKKDQACINIGLPTAASIAGAGLIAVGNDMIGPGHINACAAHLVAIGVVADQTVALQGIYDNLTALLAVPGLATAGVTSINAALTAALTAILAAKLAALDAVAAAGTSGTDSATALTGLLTSDTVIGTTPVSDTALATGSGTMCMCILPATRDGFMGDFWLWIHSVGNGTLNIKGSYVGLANTSIMFDQLIVGVAATGLVKFRAGIDFPANLPVLNGMLFTAGSAGGCIVGTHVSIGNGKLLVTTATGYNQAFTSGSNYQLQMQFTITTKKQVANELLKAQQFASQLALDNDYVTEINCPDSMAGTTIGAAGSNAQLTIPSGSAGTTLNDGMVTGINYSCVAGDEGTYRVCVLDPNLALIGTWVATFVAGVKLFYANPTPFFAPKGSRQIGFPITGKPAGYSNVDPGSYFPQTNCNLAGMTVTQGTSFNYMPAVQLVTQRPRFMRERTQANERGKTLVLDQRFRGAVLPTGGSAAAGNWFADDASGYTCNDGLIAPAAPAAGWRHNYIFQGYNHAHRQTNRTKLVCYSLTDIWGIIFKDQQATVNMGAVVRINGPANTIEVFGMNSSTRVPLDAGRSYALGWALAVGDQISLTTKRNRDKMTVIVKNIKTGVVTKISWVISSAILSGQAYLSGQVGAHFYSGAGGQKLWPEGIQTWVHCSRKPEVIWCGDSTSDVAFGDGGYGGRSAAHIVEDLRGRGNMINVSKAAQDSNGGYQQLLWLIPALFGNASDAGAGSELFFDLGVNPYHSGADTDAQWCTNHWTVLALVKTLCDSIGLRLTHVPPKPADYIHTYVEMLWGQVESGTGGNVPWINLNYRLSVGAGSADRGTYGTAKRIAPDKLHPDVVEQTPLIANDIFDQRPDLLDVA